MTIGIDGVYMTRQDIYNKVRDKIVEMEKRIYDRLNDTYHVIVDLQEIVNDAKKEGFEELVDDEDINWWDKKIDGMINELKRIVDNGNV